MTQDIATETAKPAKAKPQGPNIIPGMRIPEEARQKLEEQAFIIPVRPEEQRRQEAAKTQLKAAEPRVEAEIIRTPGAAGHVHLSAEDLANAPYGGMGASFQVGDRVLLILSAGERLRDGGWVRLL